MNKIFKYKSLISFLLVFTLSFGIFADYKKKETQAFVLEFFITQEILWALGTLVLATGVVAVSGDQVLDMGQRVVDRINDNAKLRGQVVFDGAIAVGLKIDSFIKDAVAWVAENLPIEDEFSGPKDINDINTYSSPVMKVKEFNEQYTIDVSKADGKDVLMSAHLMDADGNRGYRTDAIYRKNLNGLTGVLTFKLYKDIYGRYSFIATDGTNIVSLSSFFNQNDYIKINIYGENINSNLSKSISIPYSNPKVRENYNEDKLPVSLPYNDTKQGYIPIPTEISDTVVTPDLPLTWDNVKDTVIPLPVDSTEAPSIPDVGEHEIPDLPVDETGDITRGGILGGITDFFSWLWELLKALLMGIWNLLKAILDLLLGLVDALLTGLKDLLMFLFVPSDTYFTDVFNSFKNDLFNKLDVTSYTRLFDTDYTESSIKDITINVFGQTVTIVKFSLYEDFRGIVNTLIYAFMFFLLAIYNYNQIYKLIRGSDYVSASTTITHMGGGLTPGEQLKADSINRRLKKL